MIRCYRDFNGYCRVDSKDIHPLIGAYLEQDIQNDLMACQEMIDLLDDVSHGRRDRWTGTGNAHTVTLQPSEVSISNEYDESLGVAKMPINVFRSCIESWKKCISS